MVIVTSRAAVACNDHAADAKTVELDLLPTTVPVFGGARGGTLLMHARRLTKVVVSHHAQT